MIERLHALCAIIYIAILAIPALAQDSSEKDIFDESQFDAAVETDTAKEEKTKLEFLAGGTLVSTLSVTTLDELSAYYGYGKFSGKAFAKIAQPDGATFFVSFSMSHYLFQGTSSVNPVLKSQGADLFDLSIALSELYVSFDIAKVLFVRAGNQLIAWGPSFFWTPGDFINLRKASSLEQVDLRTGKPGIKAHVPIQSFANVYLFADFSKTVTPGPGLPVINDLVETTNIALRTDFTVMGVEYGLTGFWGMNKPGEYGFDLSGNILTIDLYGELGMTVPSDIGSTTWAVSSGMQKSLGDEQEWSLQAEFFYNSAGFEGTPDYALLIPLGQFVPFYMGKYYVFAGLTRSKIINDNLAVSLSCIANCSDLSFNPRLAFGYTVPGLVELRLAGSFACGGRDRELTFINGDNSLSITFEAILIF